MPRNLNAPPYSPTATRVLTYNPNGDEGYMNTSDLPGGGGGTEYYIPLTGTNDGEPVEGDLEVVNGFRIKTPNKNANGFNGVTINDDVVSISTEKGGNVSFLKASDDRLELGSSDVNFKGLIGSADYTDKYEDKSFVQKKFVVDTVINSQNSINLQKVIENGGTYNGSGEIKITNGATSSIIKNNEIETVSLRLSGGYSTVFNTSDTTSDHTNSVPNKDGTLAVLEDVTGIIATNKKAEYYFTDAGNLAKDESGNGNTGTYVGTPDKLPGGGFRAASGKYVMGTTQSLTGARTFYIACDVDADNNNVYHSVLGSNIGLSGFNIIQNPISTGSNIRGVSVYGATGSTDGFTTPKKTTYIITVVVGEAGEGTKIYIDGEPSTIPSIATNLVNSLTGIPFFGQTNTGGNGYLNSNIYYASIYSVKHTDSEVLRNSNAIINFIKKRGNKIIDSYFQNSTANIIKGIGDSQTYGQGRSGSYLDQLSTTETFIKEKLGWPGIGSADLLEANIGMSKLYKTDRAENISLVFVGLNDIGTKTADEIYNNIRSICLMDKLNGWKVIAMTIPKRGDVTNNTVRLSVNQKIVNGGYGFADEVIDIASDAAFSDTTNTVYYQSDQIHYTNAGDAVIAGYASNAINKITNLGYCPNYYNITANNGVNVKLKAVFDGTDYTITLTPIT